jgi:hypothetical protein
VIAKPFILAKDNRRIGTKILREKQIIRVPGIFPAAFAKRTGPMLPRQRGLPVGRLGAAVGSSNSRDRRRDPL